MRKFLAEELDTLLPYPVRAQKPDPLYQLGTPLPRVTPAERGIDLAALNKLYTDLAHIPHAETHACLVAQGGHIVSEGYWTPYAPKHWHVTHSVCKTLTGTAIGILQDEGHISLDDTIASIFPERCNLLTNRRIRSITVRHLLEMRSGSSFREIGTLVERDWLRAFFEYDTLCDPGTQFDYNSVNTYILACIVQRKTGLSLLTYLRPRLLDPLGFGDLGWETSPQGIEKGGWGLYIHLEDLVKLGQLYLQHGAWNVNGVTKQIVSASYIAQATSASSEGKDGFGYGYQLWTDDAQDAFLFNGLFGQYIAVCPKKQLVVAVNAGASNLFAPSPTQDAIRAFLGDATTTAPQTQSMQDTLDYTLSHLVSGEHIPAVPTRPKWYLRAWNALRRNRPAPISAEQVTARALHQKSYSFEPNRAGIIPVLTAHMCDRYTRGLASIGFVYENDILSLQWNGNDESHTIPISFDGFAPCMLNSGGNLFDAATHGVFTTDEDDNIVLKLRICLMEVSSTRLVKIVFLPDDSVILKIDEAPSVQRVLQVLGEGMTSTPLFKNDLLKDTGYFIYRLNQSCCPTITGTRDM